MMTHVSPYTTRVTFTERPDGKFDAHVVSKDNVTGAVLHDETLVVSSFERVQQFMMETVKEDPTTRLERYLGMKH